MGINGQSVRDLLRQRLRQRQMQPLCVSSHLPQLHASIVRAHYSCDCPKACKLLQTFSLLTLSSHLFFLLQDRFALLVVPPVS